MKRKLLLAALCVVGALGLRAQTDVTSTYITNPGFDACTAETSDVAAKTMKDYSSSGWTRTSSGSYTTIAVTAYGGGKKVGNSTTPSTKKDGTTVSGNTLGIIAGWGDNVNLQSGDITLPAGQYTISVDHYLSSSTSNYDGTCSRFGFVTASKSYLVSSTTFTASTWTTETVTFTLTESTTGKIQIGVQGLNKEGSGSPAVFYDDIKITYTDPNLAAAQTKLDGYIKKATALNGVLSDATLGTAITTAEGVRSSATTSSACNDASDDLSSAITTALNGATPVALTNGNFDTTPNNTLNGDKTTTFGGTLSTATSNPDNTKDMTANTGDHGYLYDVTSWTQYSKFNSTAAQGTTSEYGTAMPANGWSTNGTTPPATDMLGESTGAALHLSAGWSDQARYQQTINELPSGRYLFYYEVINQHSNTGIASNYTGVSGAAGDFYGTTNSFVFSSLSSAAQGEWIAQAFEFDVAKTANINFNVGFTTSTSGSGNGAKLWIDNVLVYRFDDLIVTDEEANAIIASAEAWADVKFNADDKSDLAAKLTAFKNAKNIDNYNALNLSLAQANTSKGVYETLDAAITKVEGWTATTAATGLRTKYNNGEYANDVTADDIYAEYRTAEITALTSTDAADWTSVIFDPSFESGGMTFWSAESRNDTGVKDQSNGTYSITSGDPVDGSKLFNSWGGSAENNVYQTIKSLPAGTYTLTALLAGFKDETLVLAANETTNNVVVAGDKTVGYTVFVKFTLADAADVVIKASNTKSQDGTDASFIKADNFRLYKGDVMTSDYTALNSAISTAEAKTLGFEDGQYAPYNNVDALTKLATAKAVNQSNPIAQPLLNSIVDDLNNATWTANDGDVDAIYNGMFNSTVEGDWGLTGWTRTNGWGQQQTGLSGDYATAYYNQPGSLQYGNKGLYTMPLAADTWYTLTFAYRSHEIKDGKGSNNKVTVSVLNGEDGLAATDFPGNGSTSEWKTVTKYFQTGAAGNYVLTLANDGNTWMTGVSLEKRTPANIELTSSAYLQGYKTFYNADGNYLVDDYTTIYIAGVPNSNDNYVTITSIDGNIVPKKTPVILKTNKTDYTITLTPATVGATAITNNALQVAQTKGSIDDAYVLGYYDDEADEEEGALGFYKYEADLEVGDVYLNVSNPANVRLGIIVDGEATAINSVNAEAGKANEATYNMAGQRVNGSYKGIVIKNGKKYMIK